MTRSPVNLFDLEAHARTALTPHVWDFVDGAAQDEITVVRNRRAFESIALRTRFMRDVSHRDLSVDVLGHRIDLPVMIAPARGHKMAHPDGELATARAAASAGTVLAVATGSSFSMEEVRAETDGPLWFQLYHMNRDLSAMLVRRAQKAGYSAICVTVDCPVGSPIARSARHGTTYPMGYVQGNFVGESGGLGLEPDTLQTSYFVPPDTIPFTWDDFDFLRTVTHLPIILKGIRTGEDACDAAERGVDALIVSNHGGRQLDGTLSTIEMLPEVVQAVRGSDTEVYLDSGIRRGSDVIKAISLGARAVLVGRALYWGLAWHGEEGVRAALDILRDEIDLVLAHCGCVTLEELGPSTVQLPAGFGGVAGHLLDI